jgi:hypothetical protein
MLVMAFTQVPAQAQIWITQDGPGKARIVFSSDISPGAENSLYHIAETDVHSRTAKGELILQMNRNKNQYEVEIDTGEVNTLAGVLEDGVFGGPNSGNGKKPAYLSTYEAKAIIGGSPEEIRKEAARAWDKLPLDIVLTASKAQTLQGKLLCRGKPAGKGLVTINVPGSKRSKVETDANGAFTIPSPKGKGLILLQVRYSEEAIGTFVSKYDKVSNYSSIEHWLTLTIPAAMAQVNTGAKPAGTDKLPDGYFGVLKVKNYEKIKDLPTYDLLLKTDTTSSTVAGPKAEASPAATKMLKDARAARAIWEKFPGFSANLVVNHNGQITKTKVEVQENGKVTVFIDDADTKKFVREQVASLVGHRLGGGPAKDTPCAFADKNTEHPLGRKVIVLDDAMGSSYRIKDDQLVQVNRKMKDIRFSIIVMKNDVTPEKKYLASDYVVNTWKNDTNQLVSSWTFHHTWKRVNGMDFPDTVTIVIAKPGMPMKVDANAPGKVIADPAVAVQPEKGPAVQPSPTLDTWTLTFTNHQLLPWK